jgi:hypothetical protein
MVHWLSVLLFGTHGIVESLTVASPARTWWAFQLWQGRQPLMADQL